MTDPRSEPPGRAEAHPGARTDNKDYTANAQATASPPTLAADGTACDGPVALRRRRSASWRCPLLPDGRRDPLAGADHEQWRDEHDGLMVRLGWAPPWQRERAARSASARASTVDGER